MLVKQLCKLVLGQKIDQGKLLIKKSGARPRELPYKDNMVLPDVKGDKVIILLFNKSNIIVDAFPFDPSFKEV